MLKLRRFKKIVVIYYEMLYGVNPSTKINFDKCISELENISQEINEFLDYSSNGFVKWCDYSVNNFAVIHSVFTRPFFFIWQKIINFHINKYASKMYIAGIYQNYINSFLFRLRQKKAFCNN